ncbi:MAG TPA: hypothetical protein VFE51_31475 [Verrucomicrobiae bacterium]|nr:hypothetical protein [Verrucomicrobiae bacterium]
MKLHVLADLHLDFGTIEIPQPMPTSSSARAMYTLALKVWNGLPPDSKDGL